LRSTGRTVVDLGFEQMNAFAGNLLELQSASGERVVAISQRAFTALSSEQRATLQGHADRIVAAAIPTIETLGGGSVRCMLAEVFLPRKK
jgi:hypothetical protein